MIILLNTYLIIVFFLIIKTFYNFFFLIKNFSIKKKIDLFYSILKINSIPFFINQKLINIFILSINIFFLILFNCCLSISFFNLNNTTYCMESLEQVNNSTTTLINCSTDLSDKELIQNYFFKSQEMHTSLYNSINNKHKSIEIIKTEMEIYYKKKESSEFEAQNYLLLNNVFNSKIVLNKQNHGFVENLDNYKDFKINRYSTRLINNEFIIEDCIKNYPNLLYNFEDKKLFTQGLFFEYNKFIMDNFNSFYKYDPLNIENKDIYMVFKNAANFLTTTTALLNNKIIDIFNGYRLFFPEKTVYEPDFYEKRNTQFNPEKEKVILLQLIGSHNKNKDGLIGLFEKTDIYLKKIKYNITIKESFENYNDYNENLKKLFIINKLSSIDIDILQKILLNNGFRGTSLKLPPIEVINNENWEIIFKNYLDTIFTEKFSNIRNITFFNYETEEKKNK